MELANGNCCYLTRGRSNGDGNGNYKITWPGARTILGFAPPVAAFIAAFAAFA